MDTEIFERLQLYPLSDSNAYSDLTVAIEQNPSLKMNKVCASHIYEGTFVVATVEICIPTGGVYRGLDVRDMESIIFYIPTNYPLSAPSVIPARDDFPANDIPHMNMSISGTDIEELNLCLYRGNVNEWFFQSGVLAFCDRVVEWFSDLVNGELIHNDGFENVRISNPKSFLLVDYKALTDYIKRAKTDEGFAILNIANQSFMELSVNEFDFSNRMENVYPCILAFDRIMPETNYTVNKFYKFSDLNIFNSTVQVEKGLRRCRAQILKNASSKSRWPQFIMVVVAIKRPSQVLGTFDKYDYIAFKMYFDFANNPVDISNCRIENCATIGLVNKEFAEKISGTEFVKPEISIVGVGALGSKISMHMARMGYVNQHIYDNDYLLPHNLIRHEEKFSSMIGFPKAVVANAAIKSLFRSEFKSTIHIVDILKEKVNFNNGIIIDATASERCLNLLSNKGLNGGRLLRTEIFAHGLVGATFVEGVERNPDIYDMRVVLWHKAFREERIRDWISSKKTKKDNELFIGIGCSSDTFVLDDATISNHASVVPHIVNKYSSSESGTIMLNYFNISNLSDNHAQIYNVESFVILKDGEWSIHIKSDVFKSVKEYLRESLENMGIWFGVINEYLKRIVIVDTFIPDDNKRFACKVVAGANGVEDVIEQYASNTDGLIRYVGEWHTHTGDSAQPSSTDKIAFSKARTDGIILMTILGKKETRNFVLDGRKVR